MLKGVGEIGSQPQNKENPMPQKVRSIKTKPAETRQEPEPRPEPATPPASVEEKEATDWEWVTRTPWSTEYSLTMTDSGGCSAQVVEMTRVEYLTLKEHLAKLRGYQGPDQTEAGGGDGIFSLPCPAQPFPAKSGD